MKIVLIIKECRHREMLLGAGVECALQINVNLIKKLYNRAVLEALVLIAQIINWERFLVCLSAISRRVCKDKN